MKPNRSARKLQLHRESLRQMTPRLLSADELAQVVGGYEDPLSLVLAERPTCPMTSKGVP